MYIVCRFTQGSHGNRTRGDCLRKSMGRVVVHLKIKTTFSDYGERDPLDLHSTPRQSVSEKFGSWRH